MWIYTSTPPIRLHVTSRGLEHGRVYFSSQFVGSILKILVARLRGRYLEGSDDGLLRAPYIDVTTEFTVC
jgi:hypothetical protein